MAAGGETKTKVNIIVLITTLIGGIVSWLISSSWLSTASEALPKVVQMGVFFAILCAVVVLMVIVGAIISGRFHGTLSNVLMPLIPGTIGVFLLAMLFQFIYGLSLARVPEGATSYVFIIDDSGSNETTDPQNLRYKAIKDVLSTESGDMPFMVYSFSADVEVIREMGPQAANEPEISGNSEGDTRIKRALEEAFVGYNSSWDGGDNPKFVLLTDGYSSDINRLSDVNDILNKYADSGLTVSTVGLGDCDEVLLNEIATRTGGIYVSVENANDLSGAMQKAAKSTVERDLLSVRHMRKLSILYGIIRVLFLTLLGVAIGVLAAITYGYDGTIAATGVFAALTSFAGALIMEIGTGIIHMSDRLAWLVLWILIALTLVINKYNTIRAIEVRDGRK